MSRRVAPLRLSRRTDRPSAWPVDADAFEAFYREHVDAIEGFVARRVGDRDVAADLTADVFVAAIEAGQTYREDRGAPVAWLFGIAQRVVAARLRRDSRERRATARVRGRELLDVDDAERINDRLAAEEQHRRLYAAMDQLPDGERAVLELAALDELTLAEVAIALGILPVTARVRLHRARRRLADHLAEPLANDLSPCSWRAKETAS